jgi:hypothetical protein
MKKHNGGCEHHKDRRKKPSWADAQHFREGEIKRNDGT